MTDRGLPAIPCNTLGIDLSSRAMRDTDAAWLAGFLDGEGTFTIIGHGRSAATYDASIAAANTNLGALEHCRELGGGSICRVRHGNAQWKPSYRWNVRGRGVDPLLDALIPHLILKREVAGILLAVRRTVSPEGRWGYDPLVIDWRKELKLAVNALNLRGGGEPSAEQSVALANVRQILSEQRDTQLTLKVVT